MGANGSKRSKEDMEKNHDSNYQTKNLKLFVPKLDKSSKILSEKQIKLIQKHLPQRERNLNWEKLYCNTKDGCNFSRFSSAIFYRGPVIIIIKCREGGEMGHAFGSFTSSNWKEKEPSFFGEQPLFLFCMGKDEIFVHNPSHYNDNYHYLNKKRGLGIGGRKKFFSLLIEKDLIGVSSNPSTMTFPSIKECLCDPISSNSGSIEKGIDFSFHIDVIEVYGFPLTDKMKLELKYQLQLKRGKMKNVLDNDNPDMFLLKTHGVIQDNREERE